MILIVLSVTVVGLLIAVLAIYLLVIGTLLNRVADNLDDCSNSVQQICRHAAVIGPGVKRLNDIGGKLAGAMPLLYDGAESLVASLTPAAAAPAAARGRVGYLDEPDYLDERSPAAAPVKVGSMSGPSPVTVQAGVGYMDT